MPCLECKADPTTHSFEKIGSFQNKHIFYTSYKSVKDYSNANAITEHISEMLQGISGESWIWIMDSKYTQTKHIMQLGVSLKILKLLRETYSVSLKGIYLLNSGTIIQTAMITLAPFMNKGFKESIHKLAGTPLELYELFAKKYGFSGPELDTIMHRIIHEYR
jgi:hypothetical protein